VSTALEKLKQAIEEQQKLNSLFTKVIAGFSSCRQIQKWEGISPPIKKYLELEIKILQNAPRDPDKLEWLLKVE
jgi:hypothetical protein